MLLGRLWAREVAGSRIFLHDAAHLWEGYGFRLICDQALGTGDSSCCFKNIPDASRGV
jgi:hypothetical protein